MLRPPSTNTAPRGPASACATRRPSIQPPYGPKGKGKHWESWMGKDVDGCCKLQKSVGFVIIHNGILNNKWHDMWYHTTELVFQAGIKRYHSAWGMDYVTLLAGEHEGWKRCWGVKFPEKSQSPTGVFGMFWHFFHNLSRFVMMHGWFQHCFNTVSTSSSMTLDDKPHLEPILRLGSYCAKWITWDPSNDLAYEYLSKAEQLLGSQGRCSTDDLTNEYEMSGHRIQNTKHTPIDSFQLFQHFFLSTPWPQDVFSSGCWRTPPCRSAPPRPSQKWLLGAASSCCAAPGWRCRWTPTRRRPGRSALPRGRWRNGRTAGKDGRHMAGLEWWMVVMC